MADAAPFIIVRGAPGAGKSTFADRLRGTSNAFIFEADNFFVDLVNRHDYHFNASLLGIAHSWNQGEVIRACRDCPEVPVIVANTFVHNWEIKPYLEIAKMFKRPVFVFTLHTEHDNVHQVPGEKVAKMRLGLQNFDMDGFVKKGYPIAYHCNVYTDEEATKMAQVTHIKFFEK